MTTAHPGLPEFDYIRPISLAEASQFLAEHAGEARPFLGGTDIFVRMRDGIWKEPFLVDVKNLDGTGRMHFDPQKGLVVGAAINMNQVICHASVQQFYPLLADACRTVASYQLRTRATIAGNICNASPAGDTIGACLLLNASLQVHGLQGTRLEPLSTFFTGPGKTVLQPGDIVTAIFFPRPPAGYAGRYFKLGRNNLSDLAIVGVTALGYPDAQAVSGFRFRVALASVAPVPLVIPAVEAILSEKPISEISIAEAAKAAMDACSPIDDVRGGARYRKHMVRNLTKKALTEIWQQIRDAGA